MKIEEFKAIKNQGTLKSFYNLFEGYFFFSYPDIFLIYEDLSGECFQFPPTITRAGFEKIIAECIKAKSIDKIQALPKWEDQE